MTTTNEIPFDLASLLGGTLDEIADMPEFRAFVEGIHVVNLKLEQDAKKPSVFFAKFSLVETLEQKNADDVPMEVGAKGSARMDVSNMYGRKDFKLILAAVTESTGESQVPKILELLKAGDLEFTVVTSNRTVGDKTYSSIEACKMM